MALRMSGLLRASSKRLTMTSHLVALQMCFEECLTASEKRVNPAARSTASTGMMNLSRGASSGIGALGSTKAPVASSKMFGVDGEEGFEVSTTLAK